MTRVTLQGKPVAIEGKLPAVGKPAPPFTLVDKDLKNVGLDTYKGKKKILNIVPSLDTPTCAASAKKFDEHARKRGDVVILTISADLPFAQARFCKAEGVDNVVTLSTMRGRDFSKKYGVLIADGALAGLNARAVVVTDENDKVTYAELVPEIADEPDYEKALAAL